MKTFASELISGLVAGVTFLVFSLVLHQNILLSALLCAATYLGMYLLTRPKVQPIYVEDTRLTQPQIDQMINDGKRQVAAIKQAGKAIEGPIVRAKVDDICQVADEIFDDFQKDPKDIKAARKFLNYYLSSTAKVVNLYAELSNKSHFSNDERATLDRAERILEQIEATFHKQLNKLLADDYLDLDTELAVLEATMKSEGI